MNEARMNCHSYEGFFPLPWINAPWPQICTLKVIMFTVSLLLTMREPQWVAYPPERVGVIADDFTYHFSRFCITTNKNLIDIYSDRWLVKYTTFAILKRFFITQGLSLSTRLNFWRKCSTSMIFLSFKLIKFEILVLMKTYTHLKPHQVHLGVSLFISLKLTFLLGRIRRVTIKTDWMKIINR